MRKTDFVIIELEGNVKVIQIVSITGENQWDQNVLLDRLNTADTLKETMQTDSLSLDHMLCSRLGVTEPNSLHRVWSGKASEWLEGTFRLSILNYMGGLSPEPLCHYWDGQWKTYSASFILGKWRNEAARNGLIPPSMFETGRGKITAFNVRLIEELITNNRGA